MRKVRHKNVVQFIGACTRKPNLCIVFEFMSGGSMYDYMRKVRRQHPWMSLALSYVADELVFLQLVDRLVCISGRSRKATGSPLARDCLYCVCHPALQSRSVRRFGA